MESSKTRQIRNRTRLRLLSSQVHTRYTRAHSRRSSACRSEPSSRHSTHSAASHCAVQLRQQGCHSRQGAVAGQAWPAPTCGQRGDVADEAAGGQHARLVIHQQAVRAAGQREHQALVDRLQTQKHSTAQCNSAQHSTAQYISAQHSTAQHSTALHSTAQCNSAQYISAQHSTALQGTCTGRAQTI